MVSNDRNPTGFELLKAEGLLSNTSPLFESNGNSRAARARPKGLDLPLAATVVLKHPDPLSPGTGGLQSNNPLSGTVSYSLSRAQAPLLLPCSSRATMFTREQQQSGQFHDLTSPGLRSSPRNHQELLRQQGRQQKQRRQLLEHYQQQFAQASHNSKVPSQPDITKSQTNTPRDTSRRRRQRRTQKSEQKRKNNFSSNSPTDARDSHESRKTDHQTNQSSNSPRERQKDTTKEGNEGESQPSPAVSPAPSPREQPAAHLRPSQNHRHSPSNGHSWEKRSARKKPTRPQAGPLDKAKGEEGDRTSSPTLENHHSWKQKNIRRKPTRPPIVALDKAKEEEVDRSRSPAATERSISDQLVDISTMINFDFNGCASPCADLVRAIISHYPRRLVDSTRRRIKDEDFVVLWTDRGSSARPAHYHRMHKMRCCTNYWPGSVEISTKNALFSKLNTFQRMLPQDFDFYPRTWILPQEFDSFRAVFEEGTSYITKPSDGSTRCYSVLCKRIQACV